MSDEMGRRMAYEHEHQMAVRASYYDFIMETAKENPVEGAYMLCTGLMSGNRDKLQMGYSIGSALIATLEQIPLTTSQIGVLVERIANPKPGLVDYGPTPK